MIIVDGLYANGPAMELCKESGWQYMIVLKDSCLKSVWEEFNSIKTIQSDNIYSMIWKGRKQKFYWINDIEYIYGNNKSIKIHMVVCEESWEEVNPETAEIEEKHSRHVPALSLSKGGYPANGCMSEIFTTAATWQQGTVGELKTVLIRKRTAVIIMNTHIRMNGMQCGVIML
jgi:hypothetical protein